jgi:S-adenosylmethionine-diacylglycerol 3-amino-3-carboxypropyl transferase
MSLRDWVSGRVFKFVHGNNLVYNTCWEDPRLDHKALALTSDDRVLVITSAGCNALDYLLAEPKEVNAVDMNPRQNALLELKRSAIRVLEYDDFFKFFGQGYHPRAREIYAKTLRPEMDAWSRNYWDRWIKFFGSQRRSFYFRGTSGYFARMINFYIDRVAKIRSEVTDLLDSQSVDDQKAIYDKIQHRLWTKSMRFAMNRDTTLSMLGVPKAQRAQIDNQYPGGIVQFVEDSLKAVFAELPIHDNYFWRVYITGRYTPTCSPEYLKEDNFEQLKSGGIDRLHIHTNSVQGFLDQMKDGSISRFILLDHMDWLSDRFFPLLEAEWQSIVDHADPSARVLWRSGGLRTDFLNDVSIRKNGQSAMLPELLTMNEEMADDLHQVDRVHTYGSFYIADLAA